MSRFNSLRNPLHVPALLLLASVVPAAALAQAPTPAPAAAPEIKKNWFEDPFFQISTGLPGCPAPEGPLLTFEEQRKEAHWRAERGTSCWLAGKCRDSNAYRYDKTLAAPVRTALLAVPGVEASSVWVTIQRRWVFLEGCVTSPEQAQQLESAARVVPDVETVVPAVNVGTSSPPRYPVASPR